MRTREQLRVHSSEKSATDATHSVRLIIGGGSLASRRDQLDWMPKARALAGLFGTEEEEPIPVLPAEELSLEDLDDDEEDETGEGLEAVEEAEPTEADLTKTED